MKPFDDVQKYHLTRFKVRAKIGANACRIEDAGAVLACETNKIFSLIVERGSYESRTLRLERNQQTEESVVLESP